MKTTMLSSTRVHRRTGLSYPSLLLFISIMIFEAAGRGWTVDHSPCSRLSGRRGTVERGESGRSGAVI